MSEGDTYRVELNGFTGKTPEEGAAALAEVLGIPLDEAQGYLDLAPVCITASISQAEARSIASALLKVGALIKVKKSDGPPPSVRSGEVPSAPPTPKQSIPPASASPTTTRSGPVSSSSSPMSPRSAPSSAPPVSVRSPLSSAPPGGAQSAMPSTPPPVSVRPGPASAAPVTVRSSLSSAPPPVSVRPGMQSTPPPSMRSGPRSSATVSCRACQASVNAGQRCAKCGWNESNGARWCTKCGSATALRDARLKDGAAIGLAIAGVIAGAVAVWTVHSVVAYAGGAMLVLAGLLIGAARTTDCRCVACGLVVNDAHLFPAERSARLMRRRLLGFGGLALAAIPLLAGFAMGPVSMEAAMPNGTWTVKLPWSYRDVKSEALSVPTPDGRIEATVQSASADMLYQVWRVEMPAGSAALKYESLLELLRLSFAALGGQLTAKMECGADMTCVEFDFKGSWKGADRVGRGRAFGADRSAVIVLYAGPTVESLADGDSLRYLDSFAKKR